MINNELFKVKEFPKFIPDSAKYLDFWRTIKRRCIEGYWQGGKWMPGIVYQYINIWNIGLKEHALSKSEIISRPFLRDLEWEKGYLFVEARGFSGFTDDLEYSCNENLKGLLVGEDGETILNEDTELTPNCYNKLGKLKKYIPARDYLRMVHRQNLGKPLYENQSKNVVDIESRGGGKSYWASNMIAHNFLFDGANDYDDYINRKLSEKDMLKSETLIGAVDYKYTADLIKKYWIGITNLPGAQEYNKKKYNSPFFAEYTGSLATGSSIVAQREVKIGNNWVTKGSKSMIHNRSFGDNDFAASGTRSNLILLEEVGFMSNLIGVLGTNRDTQMNGTFKMGTTWMFGCVCAGTKVFTAEGKEVNVETLHQNQGILGYSGDGVISQPILWMAPISSKPCYRIETECGKSLECSHDHPLLVSRNKWDKYTKEGNRKKVTFKKAEEIEVGEQLMWLRQVPVFGTKKMWNPRLVGLLVGDGYYGKGTPTLSVADQDIYDWLNVNHNDTHARTKKDKDNFLEISIKGSIQHLKLLGIHGQSKIRKTLPKNIDDFDMHSIAELLGGYFDADGNVYYNKKKNNTRIVLTSAYEHLLKQVEKQLYKFGVSCSIVKEFRKDGYKPNTVVYRLYINKLKDVIEFKKHITFICKHKQDKLNNLDINKHARGVHDNCYFEINPTNNKGTYYEDKNNLNNLEALYIKKVESIGNQLVYNLNADITHTYITNGFVSGNTGGDMAGGSTEAVKEVFYNPEEYDCLVFEDDFEGMGKIGYFVPAHMTLNDCKDEHGVTDVIKGKHAIEKRREKVKTNPKAYLKELENRPEKPSEAFMTSDDNMFPVQELKDRLSVLETDKRLLDSIWLGKLIQGEDNRVQYKISPNAAITDFPIRGDAKNADHTGAIQIFEQPYEVNGRPPHGLYVSGLDPYDDDTGTSLGSIHVMNTINGRIVAEYTGRPPKVEEFYEICRRLTIYYNAECCYENNKKGFFAYMDKKNSLHYLADTPKVLKDVENTTFHESGNKSKGFNATEAVNKYNRQLIKHWLMEDIYSQETFENKPTNASTIKSLALLRELIAWNPKGNFDRVSSLGACLLVKEDRNKRIVDLEEEQQTAITDDFFSRHLRE